LIKLTREEAKEFVKHPIRSYDPHGARNRREFTNTYDAFVSYIKYELNRIIDANANDLASAKSVAELKHDYHTVRTKVDNYAYHTGTALLPPYRYALSSGYPRGKHPYDL